MSRSWTPTGLANRGAAEYVIRALADAAPLVEVRRPAGDREITPLEEVVIEARAEDDYALARFDLVYAVAGEAERIVDLLGAEPVARGSGAHTLYAEELDVSPGDVVSYYLRAGDANPARVGDTRSDIYFLEVRPFEREFEDAPSQSSLSMDAGTIGQLAAVQKEIIARDLETGRPAGSGGGRRGSGGGGERAGRVAPDRARRRGADAAARRRAGGAGGAGRRGGRDGAGGGGIAHGVDRRGPLPFEMEAFAALLRAQAANLRTRVSRGGSGRSAAWQPQEDMSALFDRDLRREQETNYENRPSSPPAESSAQSDALRRVRELAERQEALGRAQDDLARRRDALGEEEAARVLARLTREQEELRERAEALEREIEARSASDGARRSMTSPDESDSSGSSAASESVGSSASSESNDRGARGAGGSMRRALGRAAARRGRRGGRAGPAGAREAARPRTGAGRRKR